MENDIMNWKEINKDLVEQIFQQENGFLGEYGSFYNKGRISYIL